MTSPRSNRTSARQHSFRPELTALEPRVTPAGNGTNLAILDFDGEQFTAREMQQSGWAVPQPNLPFWPAPDFSVGGIFHLFDQQRNLRGASGNLVLDMNGDARVTGDDARLAITLITQRVAQDFAPYDINV